MTTRLDALWCDVRQGARLIARNPGLAVTVAAIMALGIGVNAAIFSVVNGVLLRPLPFDRDDELLLIRQTRPLAGDGDFPFSVKEILDYRVQAGGLGALAEYHDMWFILLGRAEPVRLSTRVVSANFFDVLGVRPLHGRTFRPDDDDPGAPAVLVLSHGYWARSFGSDPAIVGRVFRMNDRPHTVVGVLPPMPQFPDEADAFMPTSACPFRSSPVTVDTRTARGMRVVARRRSHATLAHVQTELSLIAARLRASFREAYPESAGYDVVAIPLKADLTRAFRPTLIVLLGTAAFVLAIVCASVASLLIARLSARARELALRSALGASAGQLLRQVLVESTLLAMLGGVLGLILAAATLDLLIAFVSRFTVRAMDIRIDQTVLLFTLAMSVVTGVLFGCLPAAAARFEPLTLLREGRGSMGGGRQRLRRALVVAQIAVSFMLLMGSGLMLRSLWKLRNVDPGFRTANVLTMRIDLDFTRYNTPAKQAQVYQRILERLSREPGMTSVGAGATFPLNNTLPLRAGMLIEGHSMPDGAPPPEAFFRVASPDYFRTLSIPLVGGRSFRLADTVDAPPVVIVNESLARRYWGGGDALGKRLSFDAGRTWATVVGVVGDARQQLERASGDEIYWPILQRPLLQSSWLVTTTVAPGQMEREIRSALREIDPGQPVDRFRTLDEVKEASLGPSRLTTTLLALFAGLAVLVTAGGIAGVMAYSVQQRVPEFGMRIALGAARGAIVLMVLREGIVLAMCGLALGALGALIATRPMNAILFEITPLDGWTYASGGALIALVAGAASYLPARRAASVDPSRSLRTI